LLKELLKDFNYFINFTQCCV